MLLELLSTYKIPIIFSLLFSGTHIMDFKSSSRMLFCLEYLSSCWASEVYTDLPVLATLVAMDMEMRKSSLERDSLQILCAVLNCRLPSSSKSIKNPRSARKSLMARRITICRMSSKTKVELMALLISNKASRSSLLTWDESFEPDLSACVSSLG